MIIHLSVKNLFQEPALPWLLTSYCVRRFSSLPKISPVHTFVQRFWDQACPRNQKFSVHGRPERRELPFRTGTIWSPSVLLLLCRIVETVFGSSRLMSHPGYQQKILVAVDSITKGTKSQYQLLFLSWHHSIKR